MRKAWISIVALTLACQPEAGHAPERQRAEVVTQSGKAVSATEWCDVYYTADKAPALVLPPTVPLGAGGGIDAKPTGWVWLNLWATWCKPCVREMPLVIAFGAHLRDEGMSLKNAFVSLDEPGAELQGFIRKQPELLGATSVRLKSPDDLDGWTGQYGLKSGTTIPINVIIAPGGAVRCVRAGSIAEGDYARVRDVLRQM